MPPEYRRRAFLNNNSMQGYVGGDILHGKQVLYLTKLLE